MINISTCESCPLFDVYKYKNGEINKVTCKLMASNLSYINEYKKLKVPNYCVSDVQKLFDKISNI
jgi:hypothetical protein